MDIDSNAFDQGRPIVFVVEGAQKQATFLDPEENPPGLRIDGNSILIGPELLRAKDSWIVSFVSEGKPTVELARSYLVNVDIRKMSSRTNDSYGMQIRSALITGFGAIVIGILANLLSLLIK